MLYQYVNAPRCPECNVNLTEVETFMPIPDLRLGLCRICGRVYVVEAAFTDGKFSGWDMMELSVFQYVLDLHLNQTSVTTGGHSN